MQRIMSGALTAFGLYLRTGRRIAPIDVEVKYNPWHDEETGRFTFAGQGRHFGPGSSGGSFRGGGSFGGAGAQDSSSSPSPRRDGGTLERRANSPHHPANHSVHTVQPGDTLSRIAARRKGLTPRSLAWLNGQSVDQPLQIGQRIKVPHQAYLDAGRAAKNKLLALAYYSDTHDGKLPPNVAKPPSLERQILSENWRREVKNGYAFDVDPIKRARQISGDLQNGPAASRSRTHQRNAGKPDRRSGDDGGHFIAARFNGPRESINHFAQDANFNRGAYRSMEDEWSKELRAGRKISVTIIPLYEGASKRPYKLTVKWYVDGKPNVQDFSNEAKGKPSGK
ncbi:DNA/RNA non-specific endonuclease [Sphingobium sp.]|uniref:DNA/RNA non-specific endonuclease n=1 Tax=Sphingobium sp. TaxID=1912891 RepID=UPI003BB49D5F